jgi:hypothetical protein
MVREYRRPRNERYVGREPGYQGRAFDEDEHGRERDRRRVAQRRRRPRPAAPVEVGRSVATVDRIGSAKAGRVECRKRKGKQELPLPPDGSPEPTRAAHVVRALRGQ